ncbi:hypothetical protein CDD81_1614 [Ophiocordyceps australis]|uniref:DUF676 domain-containing protein n=1 Tax=Ophiocordyceps australis TaxID=1399860 RepID=A0A2C5XYL5_9HYPO|nr:hypothetical protein CDD81_1614 [Ophiocordyceps australis]
MASPPPLPPRPQRPNEAPAPHLSPNGLGRPSTDARTSSMQSLLPSPPADSDAGPEPRRTLLLVYIHGFYGNDESFRSFPAHVHALVRTLLADSHVIHSKVYPRYKTYRAIQLARDRFSAWLEPHQSPSTDVILVGHSMGGLLAAEVVLIPSRDAQSQQQQFKHRILGTISLDSPFLGLHPGIVVSGISSLFQPGQKPPDQAAQEQCSSASSQLETSPSLSPSPSVPPSARPNADPFFDPPYWNDEPFLEQPWMKRILHFTSKHHDEGILHAMRNHVASHLEFGGCLADYPALISRYNKLRALEDVDEFTSLHTGGTTPTASRVRFVNYYTLSPGRPKPRPACKNENEEPAVSPCKTPSPCDDDDKSQCRVEITSSNGDAVLASIGTLHAPEEMQSHPESTLSIPTISLEATHMEQEEPLHDAEPKLEALHGHDPKSHRQDDTKSAPLVVLEAIPMEEQDVASPPPSTRQASSQASIDESDLPPIPPEPEKPEAPNLDSLGDKDARRRAEKDHGRAQKAYERAVKDRAKAICKRQKLVEKRRKEAQKEAQRHDAQQEKLAAAVLDGGDVSSMESHGNRRRGKKLGKFCTLPRRVDGVRDGAWVPVYLDDVDEVGAHCGLFFPGPHYDMLVGDVGSRIASWVQEDLSAKAILDLD